MTASNRLFIFIKPAKEPTLKREILSKIIMITELGYAAGFTASAKSKPEIYVPGIGQMPYGPGSYIPHSIYANVGRCLTGEAVFDEQEMLCNIAGGLPSTFPYEADLANPDLRPLLEKYLKRNPKIPIADQLKFWLLFAEVTCSSNTGFMTYGSYHGGGSPIMEQIAITMQFDVILREHIVNAAAGIEKLDISRIAKI
jgi:aromatic ring hydroxylase